MLLTYYGSMSARASMDRREQDFSSWDSRHEATDTTFYGFNTGITSPSMCYLLTIFLHGQPCRVQQYCTTSPWWKSLGVSICAHWFAYLGLGGRVQNGSRLSWGWNLSSSSLPWLHKVMWPTKTASLSWREFGVMRGICVSAALLIFCPATKNDVHFIKEKTEVQIYCRVPMWWIIDYGLIQKSWWWS